MEKLTLRSEAICLAVIAVVAFAVFASSLSGEFVYDDNRQVVVNPLIQEPKLVWKALTSDVWAFKGDGSIAASNYWRPTFTAWSILNFRAFGLAPFGWHLTNILLHIVVCLLGFWLLRRIGLERWLALGVAVVFAVHPVHTESVAWIAGSPDLLFAAAFLGSLIFVDRALAAEKFAWLSREMVAATVLFALAVGAKEVALLCLPIYFVLYACRHEGKSLNSSLRKALSAFLPIVAVAVAYFFARIAIIGELSRPAEDSAGLGAALMTVPEALMFYLRQVLVPIRLAPNYPLRPVASLDLWTFIVPLIVVLAAGAAAYLIAKRSRLGAFAISLAVLPLIAALNITAFPQEQIVHDRYLYLPLLGFLVALVIAFREFVPKLSARNVGISLFALALPLAVRTYGYNQVWALDLRLWQHAVTQDERSAFNWNQLGAELTEQKRFTDAIDAYGRSIDIKRTPLAVMGRARNYSSLKRYEDAIADLRPLTQTPLDKINAYTLYQIYETLGVVQQAAGDADSAEQTLREARGKLPIYAAALTEKLGVVLYIENRKQDALNELESVRAQADRETLIDSKVVYLRLGMLYAEAGRVAEARRDLQTFLAATANVTNPEIIGYRAQAATALAQLK